MPDKATKSQRQFIRSIGRNINDRRVRSGMSKFEMSKKGRFDTTTLSNVESGDKNPTIRVLLEIAEALECEIGDFLP